MRFPLIASTWLSYLLPIFFLMAPSLLNAQNGSPGVRKSPPPAWVKPVSEISAPLPDEKAVEGGQYLVLFDEQFNLEKEAVYYKVIRQITSEAGVQNSSEIAITFSPGYQQLTFHSIRVLRDGQQIDQLDPDKIKLIRNETDLKRFLYSGLYTAYLNLEDVRPGDRVEYSYTLAGMNPVLDHHFGNVLYFNAQTPISRLFMRIVAAPGQQVYFKYFNGAPKASQSVEGGKHIYEWDIENRPPYLPEGGEPGWYYGAAYLQVTTDSGWNAIARWAARDMVKAGIAGGPLIQKAVSEWNSQAGDSDLYFVRLATRFVQDQIRYMGVEIGPYSHLPHNPEQVLKQRYGDCKDKSLLLCTFLRLRHLDASVALVNAYDGSRLENYLPSTVLFDHAIVTFKYKGEVYWIDPTITYQRGTVGNMATPDYGYALVAEPDEHSLTKMHVNAAGNTQVTERFTLPDDKKGAGTLAVISTFYGGNADDIRQQFKTNSFSSLQKAYLDYYNQLYHHVSLADSIQYQDNEEDNRITINEKYTVGEIWSIIDTARSIRQFTVYAKSIQDRLPQTANDNRKAPLALMTPLNFSYCIQIIPPGVWDIQPADEIITRGPYYYSFASSKSGDTINLDYIYQTYQDYIPADSVKQANADFKLISDDLAYNLTQNDSIAHSPNKVSWISIWISLISLAVFSWLAVKVYRFSPPKARNRFADERLIGGWLIVLCVGLCVTPIRLLLSLVTTGYYSPAVWVGAQAYHGPGMTIFVVIELAINMFLVVSSFLLLFLFFKRRSTLPVAFTVVYGINIVFLVLDYFIGKEFLGIVSAGIPRGTIQLIVYAGVWIPYLLLSKRSRETFVFPYNQETEIALPPDMPAVMTVVHKLPEDKKDEYNNET